MTCYAWTNNTGNTNIFKSKTNQGRAISIFKFIHLSFAENAQEFNVFRTYLTLLTKNRVSIVPFIRSRNRNV